MAKSSFVARPDFWDTPLSAVLGRSGSKITKKLGLNTVTDLLYYFPRRYHEKGRLSAFNELVEGEEQSVVAQVADAQVRSTTGRRWMLTLKLTDGQQFMQAVFWARSQALANWMAGRMKIGSTMLFSGKPSRYRNQLQLSHPSYENVADENLNSEENFSAQIQADAPVPIYPAVSGLPTWVIARAIRSLLVQVNQENTEDWISTPIIQKLGLMPLLKALNAIHMPMTVAEYQQARYRFKTQEALLLQTVLAQNRVQTESLPAPRFPTFSGDLYSELCQQLPFSLTSSQREVMEKINQVFKSGHPLNHLLQGDVGAGKTLVALLAMVQAVQSGFQAVLLAPTEVLVEQHYRSIGKLLGKLAKPVLGQRAKVPLYRLTASLKTAEKRQILAALASGEPGIVVGTHALLGEQVQLPELGLVIVDEQHRFGVEQRDHLRQQGSIQKPVHLLVMTATPIPRTIAMTSFGDLETLILEGVPAGRKPVQTHIISAHNPRFTKRCWARMAEEIHAGGRAFIVCPAIDSRGKEAAVTDGHREYPKKSTVFESRSVSEPLFSTTGEILSLECDADRRNDVNMPAGKTAKTSVMQLHHDLAGITELSGISVGVLHGRLTAEEKELVMEDFRSGKTPILIATTVIEVGVDVPDATMMVIMDADNFGLSQLHQLRGRIGRGSKPGLCICWTSVSPDTLAGKRLLAFASTTDGFELAQKDLEIRNAGDPLGASQSGKSKNIKILDILRDEEIIRAARKAAEEVVVVDPELSEYPAWRAAVERYTAVVAAEYLEKG